MTSTTRTIKPKPFRVKSPDGKIHLAYAQTLAGAIRDVKEHTKQAEEWSAEPATAEDLFVAGREKIKIINAPDSIAAPPAQTDAFTGDESDET